MDDAMKSIRDIPIRRAGVAFDARTPLHVLAVDLRFAATDVRADGSAGDGTADGCDVLAATTADLVTEHAADHGTDDCAGNVRSVAPFDDLLPFDPAALFGRIDDRSHRDHRHDEVTRTRGLDVRDCRCRERHGSWRDHLRCAAIVGNVNAVEPRVLHEINRLRARVIAKRYLAF